MIIPLLQFASIITHPHAKISKAFSFLANTSHLLLIYTWCSTYQPYLPSFFAMTHLFRSAIFSIPLPTVLTHRTCSCLLQHHRPSFCCFLVLTSYIMEVFCLLLTTLGPPLKQIHRRFTCSSFVPSIILELCYNYWMI